MKQKKVCVLDYSSGNVGSVCNLVGTMCDDVVLSNDRDVIRESTHYILPGVGAFGACMSRIRDRLPLEVLADEVHGKGKPFLGICIGMQVLADKGFEFGENEGLGWIPGEVRMLDTQGMPLPHIGWNDVDFSGECALSQGFAGATDFYFVHSYAFVADDDSDVVGATDYGSKFVSMINRRNVFGVQFHPEKSQKAGRLLMDNFLSMEAL